MLGITRTFDLTSDPLRQTQISNKTFDNKHNDGCFLILIFLIVSSTIFRAIFKHIEQYSIAPLTKIESNFAPLSAKTASIVIET